MSENENIVSESEGPWYKDVTPYMWLVLLIASLGWMFDIFEGQIFVASMSEAMPSLLDKDELKDVPWYNNMALNAFLLGGAIGGVFFGMLSDRIGRVRTMIITILVYSLFTTITAFAQSPMQMIVLRFLVALGVGGEWAVASAMVAEVFPKKARAWSLGIFHASSVGGTYLAVLAGAFIVGNEALQSEAYPTLNWRLGFFIGVIPAMLTIWIRMKLKEPEQWVEARKIAKDDKTKQTGQLSEIFKGVYLRRTLVGVVLSTVGLTTFWGVHIYGKNLMRFDAERQVVSQLPEGATEDDKTAALKDEFSWIKKREMLGMFLVTTGGGLGLIFFGPLCERIGRRKAFLFMHVGGLVSALVLFKGLTDPGADLLYILLPIFGFLTLGMHAGYAIYFPELYPTRLRGTGAGFCFNFGRIAVIPFLTLTGWLQREVSKGGLELSMQNAASLLSCLYVLGIFALIWAPETKGQELPE